MNEVGTNLQAVQAVNDAREGLAIGLWSFLGAELIAPVVPRVDLPAT